MFKLDLDGPTRPKVYFIKLHLQTMEFDYGMPGRGTQSVAPLTQESEVPGSKFGSATYFRFTFRWFKKDSCQLLAEVCVRSTG